MATTGTVKPIYPYDPNDPTNCPTCFSGVSDPTGPLILVSTLEEK